MERDLRAARKGRSIFDENLGLKETSLQTSLEDELEDLQAMPIPDEMLTKKQRLQRSRSRSNSTEDLSSSLSVDSSDYRTEYLGSAMPGYLAYSPPVGRIDSEPFTLATNRRPSAASSRIPIRSLSNPLASDSTAQSSQDMLRTASTSSQPEYPPRSSQFSPPRRTSSKRLVNGRPLRTDPDDTSFPTSNNDDLQIKKQRQSSKTSSPAPRTSPSSQTRARAVTGMTSKVPDHKARKASGSGPIRQRAVSTSTISSTAIPPWQDEAPVLYQSDIIAKSDSLFSLASKLPKSASRHDFDDMIIPTVAKQLHRQMLEGELAKGTISEEQTLPDSLAGGQPRGGHTLAHPQSSAAGQQTLHDLPEAVSMPSQVQSFGEPARSVSRERQEMWEREELASPGIAMRTFQQQQDRVNNRTAELPPEKTAGCCSSCTIV